MLQRGLLKVLTPMNEDGSIHQDVFAFQRCLNEGKDAFDKFLTLYGEAGQSESLICLINRSIVGKNVRLEGLKAGLMYSSHRDWSVYTVDENGCLTVSVEDILILKSFR